MTAFPDPPAEPVAPDAAAATRLLMEQLSMSGQQARHCVQVAGARFDLLGYVQRLITRAQQMSNVRNPPGLVTYWIEDREDPPPPAAPGGSREGLLDPAKYLYGKYAHLFNPAYDPRAGAAS